MALAELTGLIEITNHYGKLTSLLRTRDRMDLHCPFQADWSSLGQSLPSLPCWLLLPSVGPGMAD